MNMVRKLPVLAATLAAATLGAGGMVLSAGTATAHASMRPAAAPVCAEPPGPYHLKANAAPALGLTYHGVGNQVTVTPSIGDTTLQCVQAPDIYVLHNNAGNCIRITDASNDYNVIEESGCNTADTNYEWEGFPVSQGHVQFENLHFTNEWLGTEHCPPGNGDAVEGVPNQAGQCVTWILGSL
jgi:hypothetical protein